MKSAVVAKRIVENQSGLTLVEALLALGLISIIALSSVSYFSQVTKFSSRKHESCRLYNMSFLNRLRSVGTSSAIANFTPLAGTNIVSDTAPLFSSPTEVAVSKRWPNESILGGVTVPPLLNNYLLINSNMNIIQALYNGVSGICGGYVNLPSVPFGPNSLSITPPQQLGVIPNGFKVQIVPYDIDTGKLSSTCPSPVYVSPRGTFLEDGTSGSPFFGSDAKVARPINVKSNIGFAVRARTEFINEEGKNDMCITEQRFQYETDAIAPAAPNILTSTMITGPDVCGEPDKNEFQIEVGYEATPTTRIEPGSVLLCRDESVMPSNTLPLPPGPPGTATMKTQCLIGNDTTTAAAPQFQVAAYIPNNYFLPPGFSGYDYANGTSDMGIKRWVPCYNLTICNVAPETVQDISSSGTPKKIAYRLRYKNLRSDCRIIVRTAGLDTAANSSLELDSPTKTDPGPKMFEGPGTAWDVPRPQCRHYCGDWPTGYFTCAPSC